MVVLRKLVDIEVGEDKFIIRKEFLKGVGNVFIIVKIIVDMRLV